MNTSERLTTRRPGRWPASWKAWAHRHDRVLFLAAVGVCTYGISYDNLAAFFAAGLTPWPLYWVSPVVVDQLMLAALWFTRGVHGARVWYAWVIVGLFTLVSWFASAAHPYTQTHRLDDTGPTLWQYMHTHPLSVASSGLVSVALALIAHLYLWTRPRPEESPRTELEPRRRHVNRRRPRAPVSTGSRRPFVPVPAVLEQVRARLAEAEAEGRRPNGRDIGRSIGRHEATARKYLRYLRHEERGGDPEPAETVA
ncbi:MAG: hypothetical protein J2P44_05205 [Candidatus Dormibacteraeota bacterium]|nr:hypothetical protein [Candidatus Dormibacteraeota bacterium]